MKIFKIHPSEIPERLILSVRGLWVLQLWDPPFEERYYGFKTRKDVELALKINKEII